MIDTNQSIFEKTSVQLPAIMERIFAAARPEAVYSKPIVAGEYTVITACEVSSGGGFGGGFGLHSGETVEAQNAQVNSGGNGGGGGCIGRPVAVIAIGPDGVTVKPILDVTKIVLAAITSWLTMFTLLRKLRKASRH